MLGLLKDSGIFQDSLGLVVRRSLLVNSINEGMEKNIETTT